MAAKKTGTRVAGGITGANAKLVNPTYREMGVHDVVRIGQPPLTQKQKDDKFISRAVGYPAATKIVSSDEIIHPPQFSTDDRDLSYVKTTNKKVAAFTTAQKKKIREMRKQFANDRSNRAR